MSKKKHKYLAVDTTIMQYLAFIDWLVNKYGHIDIDKIHSETYSQLKRDFNYYKMLYDHMKNGKIRIVALEYVFRNFEKFESFKEFMKENCYYSDFDSENYKHKSERINELVDAYFNDYSIRDVKFKAPFDTSDMTEKEKKESMEYAIMMAQATVEGCLFVTNNNKIVLGKVKDHPNKTTTNAIIEVNIVNGYYDVLPNGKRITPRPVLFYKFAPILNNYEHLITPELSTGISKGGI